MQIEFQTTAGGMKGRAVMLLEGKEIKFEKGVRKTTSKDEIELLLSSDLFRRGELKLVTEKVHVAKYLQDDQLPEVLTVELLKKLDDDGIRQLADHYQTQERNLVPIIRAELRGKPVDDEAQTIIDESMAPEKSEAEKNLEAALADGTLTFKSPWYKSADGSFKTRDRKEVLKWLESNNGM